jgi:hypothetical protein
VPGVRLVNLIFDSRSPRGNSQIKQPCALRAGSVWMSGVHLASLNDQRTRPVWPPPRSFAGLKRRKLCFYLTIIKPLDLQSSPADRYAFRGTLGTRDEARSTSAPGLPQDKA